MIELNVTRALKKEATTSPTDFPARRGLPSATPTRRPHDSNAFLWLVIARRVSCFAEAAASGPEKMIHGCSGGLCRALPGTAVRERRRQRSVGDGLRAQLLSLLLEGLDGVGARGSSVADEQGREGAGCQAENSTARRNSLLQPPEVAEAADQTHDQPEERKREAYQGVTDKADLR